MPGDLLIFVDALGNKLGRVYLVVQQRSGKNAVWGLFGSKITAFNTDRLKLISQSDREDEK